MGSLLCLCGLLLGIWILPHIGELHDSVAIPGRGRAGVVESNTPLLNQKICGHPTVVFQQLGFSSKDVPTTALLAQLPLPQTHAVQQAGDMSYDPQTDTFCTIGWRGIYTRYIQQSSLPPGSVETGNGTVPASTSTSWVQDILNGLFSSFAHSFADFLQGLLSWAKTFGFMFITPDGLTYTQPVVIHLHAWMVGVMDSLLVLALILGGYKVMLGQHDVLREFAPGFLFAAISGTFSLFFITQAIQLQNALCVSLLGVLASAGVGDLSLPLGVINWATAPAYEVLTYLIDLLMCVCLSIQMLVRIGLLDFLIVLAPLGLLCFRRLWIHAFLSTLLLQFFQTVCIGLGSTLIASFGHASYSVISMLVGIATLYIAFKLPGMMLSNVVRHSVGEVHRDAGRAIQTVAEFAVFKAA
ncbi:hypothetical protein KDW_31120 [Dictyobacter vulcani]|uniref:Uncharacterized protein n=2 Tax=Dictyobacter vulcani TaxID=2607529 RepID=A0A5J4KR86_9CHLR|nr:hypothetical protein KDW_31120 [Dictyobacter vulcani]